jgi:hypothetical protein
MVGMQWEVGGIKSCMYVCEVGMGVMCYTHARRSDAMQRDRRRDGRQTQWQRERERERENGSSYVLVLPALCTFGVPRDKPSFWPLPVLGYWVSGFAGCLMLGWAELPRLGQRHRPRRAETPLPPHGSWPMRPDETRRDLGWVFAGGQWTMPLKGGVGCRLGNILGG